MTDVFRNGRVHVKSEMCPTCIFRPGNLMHLEEGRVTGMVREGGEGGCIPCHETLYQGGGEAVCRGFYNGHRNQALQIAQRLGIVEEVA